VGSHPDPRSPTTDPIHVVPSHRLGTSHDHSHGAHTIKFLYLPKGARTEKAQSDHEGALHVSSHVVRPSRGSSYRDTHESGGDATRHEVVDGVRRSDGTWLEAGQAGFSRHHWDVYEMTQRNEQVSGTLTFASRQAALAWLSLNPTAQIDMESY
jgi:hypothetical protein